MVLAWASEIKHLGCAEPWKLSDVLDAPVLIFASWQVTGEDLGSCDKELWFAALFAQSCAALCAQSCAALYVRAQPGKLTPPALLSSHWLWSHCRRQDKSSKGENSSLFSRPPKVLTHFNGTHRLRGRVNQANKDVLLLSDACNYSWFFARLSASSWVALSSLVVRRPAW